MRRVATIVVCLLAHGCAKTNPYKCTSSDQCVLNGQAGTCQPEGYCAFPDMDCPSGTRFESGAGGGFGGECTAPPDAPLPPCGALGQACCTGEQGSAGPCVGGTYCNAGTCDECVADMTFGHDLGCYLKKDHTVWCAGNAANGMLGSGATSNTFVDTPVQVVDATGPITDATALGGGYGHNCVVRANGAVSCWGRNFNGQLGDNTTNDANKAVRVNKAMGSGTAPLTGIADLDGGGSMTCAHDTTGIVWCWGAGGDGELGDGLSTTRHVAAPVMAGSASFSGAENIVSGDDHLCTKKGADYWCWGNGGSYQLGNGSNSDQALPIKVATTASIALGNYHTCWVNADTTIACVGANWHGQMGNGSGNDFAGANQQTPSAVITESGSPFMGAAELAAGGAMTCARTTDGRVWCWGDNKYGQIGGGSPTPFPALVLDAETAKPLEHVDRIVAKYAHVCAHTTDAGWKCWGRGRDGELGDGKQRSRGLATPLGVSCP
jgi:alpha-tubulin suppressor-like RCC1 family protein